MPFLADSTYANLKRTFEESFRLANKPGDPDPELDVQVRDLAEDFGMSQKPAGGAQRHPDPWRS